MNFKIRQEIAGLEYLYKYLNFLDLPPLYLVCFQAEKLSIV